MIPAFTFRFFFIAKTVFLSFLLSTAVIAENTNVFPWQQNEFLPAEQAFPYHIEFSEALNPELSPHDLQKIQIQWQIVEDYYLYHQAFKLIPEDSELKIYGPFFSHNPEIKFDPNFDKDMAIFKDDLLVSFYIEQIAHENLESNTPKKDAYLTLSFQGCAEGGLCYPMQEKQISRSLDQNILTVSSDTIYTSLSENLLPMQRFDALLANASLLKIFLIFLLLGIGLCLTPCVLPMVPILANVVLGAGKNVSTRQAFTLSSSYVMAMTITYTLVGVLAAILGAKANLQIWMQHPAILGFFAVLFVLLALAMFDIYQLKLPDTLQSKLDYLSYRQQGGKHIGASIMGVLSAIVVSPCISAPLAATLVFISTTGDVAIGATALFALGLGMGLPLIVLCTFGINLLPKAGAWLQHSKKVFGLLLLAVAIWILGRFMNPQLILLLWAMLAIFASFSFGAWQLQSSILKTLSMLLLIWGIVMFVGAIMGNHNPLKPLDNFYMSSDRDATFSSSSLSKQLPFTIIYSSRELAEQLELNRNSGKILLLDFYADWCVSCKQMEHDIFNNPAFKQDLEQFTLIKADLTHNTIENFQLLESLQLFGPPAILFFDNNGEELKQFRMQGMVTSQQFRQVMQVFNNR